MADLEADVIPVAGHLFEDTIDGYFPLSTSLGHLMTRQRAQTAWVSITHAPILHVPGLPPNAPVPLRTASDQVGMLSLIHI